MDHLKVLDIGTTTFRCGCWLEMDYNEIFPLVDGGLCDKHQDLNDDVGTPDMYKVFWLFLREKLWKLNVKINLPIDPNDPDERENYIAYCEKNKLIPKPMNVDKVTDKEATFNDVSSRLNISDFNIEMFKSGDKNE